MLPITSVGQMGAWRAAAGMATAGCPSCRSAARAHARPAANSRMADGGGVLDEPALGRQERDASSPDPATTTATAGGRRALSMWSAWPTSG